MLFGDGIIGLWVLCFCFFIPGHDRYLFSAISYGIYHFLLHIKAIIHFISLTF